MLPAIQGMDFPVEVVADFAVIMAIAGIVTLVFHKIKQPLILGYLVAGFIIGPYSPPFSFIRRPEVFGAAAELGVILLLFGIGLEFPLGKLMKIGLKKYATISLIEIALMFALSFLIGVLFKWPLMDSLFLGTALASSSTVVIAKVLADMGKLKDTPALVMMGVLVVEDLIVVLILAIVTTVVGAGSLTISGLAWTVGKIALFVIGSLLVGLLVIPRFIDWINNPERGEGHAEHDEVILLVALGLCFGLAVAANQMGVSLAIGAFLAGVIIASAKCSSNVAHLTHRIKEMFGAMFFVSVGALIDLSQFRSFLLPALLVIIIMLVGKVIGCGLGARLMGYDIATAFKVGLGMGQIGEFAFIVAIAGQELGVTSPFLFPTIGVAVAITTFLTPYMIKFSYRTQPERWFAKVKLTSASD